MKVIWTWAFSR